MTTTPTASPELPDLDHLQKIADDIDTEGLFRTSCELREIINSLRRAHPEGEAPQGEAFAWAVLAENGNVIIWSKNRGQVEPVAKQYGRPVVPVIALSAAQHAESGAQADGLPPLPQPGRPEWDSAYGYTAGHMRGYARAALAAQSQGAQAAHGVESDEFNRLLGEWISSREYYQSEDQDETKACWVAFIAHIEAWGRAALAAKAEAPAPEWGRVRTVADMVRNLMTLDQAEPIFSAFHVDFDGARRCRTSPISISHERVIDGKWVDSTRKDVPYSTVVWAKPDERAQQAAAPVSHQIAAIESLGRNDPTVHAFLTMKRRDGLDWSDVLAQMVLQMASDKAALRNRLLDIARHSPSAPGTPEAPAGFVPFGRFHSRKHADGSVTTFHTRDDDPDSFVLYQRAAQLDGGQTGVAQ